MADLLKASIGVEFKGQAGINQAAAAIGKTEVALKKLSPAAGQANTSLVNLSRVVQDAPFGFIGIANNIDPLLQSFQSLKAQTGSVGGAFKALGSSLLGGAGLALAVSTVSSLLVVYGDRLFGASKAAKEAKTASDQLKESINGIFSDAAKEAAEAATFVGILKSETETRERKLAAIKELQRIQPEVFANLKLEGNAVVGLDAAYQNYLENLKTVIAVKIKQAQLEQLIGTLLEKQGVTLTNSEKKIKNFVDAVKKSQLDRARATGGGEAQSFVESILGSEEKNNKSIEKIKGDINALISEISQLSKGVKVNELKIKPKKLDFDFDEQFSKIVYLKKPIPVEGRIFDFNVAQEGTDLLKKVEYEFSDRLKSMEKLVITPKLNFSAKFLADSKALAQIKTLAEQLSDAFNSAFTDGISGLAEGIGDAIAGQDFGKSILSAMGGLLTALGKALIQYGIVKEGLDKLLGPGGIIIPGAAAIALGVLATAAGSAVKKFGGARALGGPVGAGRSYLVGERGPELFTPGVSGNIIPNGRLGSVSNSFGGMQVQGVLTGRGNDLLAIINSTGRSNGRLV